MSESEEIFITGFDPGATTGYAIISVLNKKITPLDIGQSTDPTLQDLIPHIERSSIIILEGFWVNPQKARKGHFDYDNMVAPRVIGALQYKAQELGKQVVIQPAAIKPVGFGFSGRDYVKGKKNQHQWDALAHAVYYAVKVLHASPVSKIPEKF